MINKRNRCRVAILLFAAAPCLFVSGIALADAVDTAIAQIGDTYDWGKTGPDLFDCSGLTQYAYAQNGVTIPRNSRAQAEFGIEVPITGPFQRGDLLFFDTSETLPATEIVHVGVFENGVTFINANGAAGIVKRNTLNSWWSPRLLKARRVNSTRLVRGSVEGSISQISVTNANGQQESVSSLLTQNFNVRIGDSIDARFAYELDRVPDQRPSDPTEGYYQIFPASPGYLTLRVQGVEMTQVGGLNIRVLNNFATGQYKLSRFRIGAVYGGFPGDGEDSVSEVLLDHAFDAIPNTLVKSDRLPESAADIDASQANYARIYYRSNISTSTVGTYVILADIDLSTFRIE